MPPVTQESQLAELHMSVGRIANDLRGSVDNLDFKSYVLDMLFYRCVSENLTNYINKRAKASGSADFDFASFPDEHTECIKSDLISAKNFFIRPSELFSNVRARASQDENLNETLEKVVRNIKDSILGTVSEGALRGVFDDFDVNSPKLGSTIVSRNATLVKLLDAVGDLSVGNIEDNSINIFGDAYEYLMQMYSSKETSDHEAKKKASSPEPSTDDQELVVPGEIFRGGPGSLIGEDPFALNVLDETLYDYRHMAVDLGQEFFQRASSGLLATFVSFLEDVPAIAKVADGMRDRTELVMRDDLLPESIKAAISEGKAAIQQCKDGRGGFYLQVRSTVKGLVIDGREYGVGRKLKDITLDTKTVPPDVAGALQCLAQQRQLNTVTREIAALSKACEEGFDGVIRGQRDDRMAQLMSARGTLIQALAVRNPDTRRSLIEKAITAANEARVRLAFQVVADIDALDSGKSLKATKMEKAVRDINFAIGAMNTAVQIELLGYQALGEPIAQWSVIADHRAFVRDALLKKITRKGMTQTAWDIVMSSRDGSGGTLPDESRSLPRTLIESYDALLGNGTKIQKMEQMERNVDDQERTGRV